MNYFLNNIEEKGKKSEDEILDELFLAKINKNNLRKTFDIDEDDYYFYENETFLIVPKNHNVLKFKISNSEFAEHSRDYRQEIEVNLEKGEISFNIIKMGNVRTCIKATFDKEIDGWDVRSYIKEKNVPSTLAKCFEELENENITGETHKASFENIITSVIKNNQKERAKVLKK